MSDKVKGKREIAEAAGRRGERLAALWLQLKGYRILERRFKTKIGEIDLIAQKGRAIVFIEVKHRKTADAAFYSVTDFQADRISNAAQLYMGKIYRTQPEAEMRFDIIVTGAQWRPIHVKDAWR